MEQSKYTHQEGTKMLLDVLAMLADYRVPADKYQVLELWGFSGRSVNYLLAVILETEALIRALDRDVSRRAKLECLLEYFKQFIPSRSQIEALQHFGTCQLEAYISEF